MRQETAALKAELRSIEPIEAQLSALAGAYRGRDAFVLTCGASLNQLDHDDVVQRLRHELVICVKQAMVDYGEIADFHLFNTYNHQRYDYTTNPGAITVAGVRDGDPPMFGPRPDVVLRHGAAAAGDRILVTRDFARHALDVTPVRPWGGIMFEIGIYLAVHLGARNIFVAGWDLAPAGATVIPHHYEGKPGAGGDFIARAASHAQGLPLIGEMLARSVNLARYNAGKRYNVTLPAKDEMHLATAASKELYAWLQTRSVGLHLVTKGSYLHQDIPRVEMFRERIDGD